MFPVSIKVIKQQIILLVLLVALMIALIPPAQYFYIEKTNLTHVMDVELANVATEISGLIYTHPKTWYFQMHMLESEIEGMAKNISELFVHFDFLKQGEAARWEVLRVLDLDGTVLAETGKQPIHFVISRSYRLNNGFEEVGKVEYIVGLQSILNMTALIAIVSVFFALFTFVSVRRFILRALDESYHRLETSLIDLKKTTTSKEFLDAIIDNMMQGVVTIDKENTIKTFNHWAEVMFGYKAAEVIGQNVKILMPEPYHSNHDQYLQNYKETGEAKVIGQIREVSGRSKKGKVFPISLSVAEVVIDDEFVFVGLVRDITEQRNKEYLLQQARKKADEANHAKSDFLANMSHELRTPLNSILGLTRMFVEDPDISKDNREMADIVYKSSINLLETVNDILDISKIESGNMVLEIAAFDFKNTLSNIVEFMAPMASEKGVFLQYHYENNKIPYLLGDSLRVRRIITNLVSNAIKYTETGGIFIEIDSRFFPSEDKRIKNSKVEIHCVVKDTGIGIAEDRLKSIFDKFIQADLSTTRKYGGTGLGLAITKNLVEMMGGEIGLESRLTEGSSFWFKISFDITDHLDEKIKRRTGEGSGERKIDTTRSRVPASKAKILIAEDHLLNQDFIKRLLRRQGFKHIDLKEDGTSVLEAREENEYDLILMDCHMPEKSGYEVTEDIRKTEKKTGKHIPIVALTADAMKGTHEKCLKAGMDECITKPVDSDELKYVLEQWIVFSEEVKKAKTGNKHSVVDTTILEEYANTPEDLKRFVDIFLDQSREGIKIMEKHCVEGESIAWTEAAHKFKSGAGMLGAKTLQKHCIQAQAMEDATAEERKKLFKKIRTEYEKVERYLNDFLRPSDRK